MTSYVIADERVRTRAAPAAFGKAGGTLLPLPMPAEFCLNMPLRIALRAEGVAGIVVFVRVARADHAEARALLRSDAAAEARDGCCVDRRRGACVVRSRSCTSR